MLDLITLIHSENDPRRFPKTREDSTLKRRARCRQAGPTWQPLGSRFGVVSSRVIWNLLVPVSQWISMINFDM